MSFSCSGIKQASFSCSAVKTWRVQLKSRDTAVCEKSNFTSFWTDETPEQSDESVNLIVCKKQEFLGMKHFIIYRE